MRTILLGRKPVACDALRFLLAQGVSVAAVVTSAPEEPDPYPERLFDVASAFQIPVLTDGGLYEILEGGQQESSCDLQGIDFVLSLLHQQRIRRSLIDLGRLGCINFHPAPLPEYRGWGTYTVAILEGIKRWGASAHFVDENFDTGPLIDQIAFDVDSSQETALSLMYKTQPFLLALFQKVVGALLRGHSLPGIPQGPGRSFTRKKVLGQRFLTLADPPDLIERKIRAFWYPPNPCAEFVVNGMPVLLINQRIFENLAPRIHAVMTESPSPES